MMSIPDMIKQCVKYQTTERSGFNMYKFKTVNITFETSKGRMRFSYNFQLGPCRCSECIREFTLLKDHVKHHYGCHCNECSPPLIRPAIKRYVFLSRYLWEKDSKVEHQISEDKFNTTFFRTSI